MLRFGCSARLKLLLSALILVCAGLVWKLLPGWENQIIFIAGLPLVFLLLCLVAATIAVWNSFEVSGSGVKRQSALGSRHFRREDFVAHELLSERPGRKPSLMLRFRTGVLHLEAEQLAIDPKIVLDFIREEWGTRAEDSAATAPLGEVDSSQVFRYESLHVSLALITAACLMAAAVRLPLVWVAAVLAVLCLRIVWRALGRIETSENSIIYVHYFRAPIRLDWSQVERVDYWNSFCQGGVRIRGGGQSIRVYRWIEGYPKLNRLLHDKVAAERFTPSLDLPVRMNLNQWQRTGTLYSVGLVAANALPFLFSGSYFVFLGFVVIPAVVGVALMLISQRTLEIDRDEIRDTSVIFGVKRVNRFKRADIVDARLGRQISAGGLWIKFKNCRLEVRNLQAGLAPEQVLACMRREWAWEQNPRIVETQRPESGGIRGVA